MNDTENRQNEAEGQTAAVMPTAEEPAEQPVDQQATEGDDLVLPEGASERTKEQFEKLKAQLREKEEKLQALQTPATPTPPQFSSVLDELDPRAHGDYGSLSQAQVEKIQQSLVDENGYVDTDLLQKTLQEANRRAQEAETRARNTEARIEKFEQTQTEAQVHTQYPQLNPYSPTFDPKFYEFVKNEMIGQMMKGQKDYAAAAKKADEFFASVKGQEQARVAQVQEKQEVISQKERASTTAVAGGYTPQSADAGQLRQRAMSGDSHSLGQLLNTIDH